MKIETVISIAKEIEGEYGYALPGTVNEVVASLEKSTEGCKTKRDAALALLEGPYSGILLDDRGEAAEEIARRFENSVPKKTLHETFYGFAPHLNEGAFLYNGHDSPVASGTLEEVISYLQGLIPQIPPIQEDLTWEGSNGLFFSGQDARKAILEEIENQRERAEEGSDE